MKTFIVLNFLGCIIYAVTVQYMSFWEYSPVDFAGWTNFGVTSNLSQIEQGYSLGINHLFNLEGTFFTGSSVPCTNHSGVPYYPLVLKQNYIQEWNNLLPTLNELYHVNKSIFGFFMGDELVWNGLNPNDLNTAIKLVRDNFTDSIIYTNEATAPISSNKNYCGKNVNYTKISSYLDWFSIDMYHFDGVNNDFVSSVEQFYNKYVYPVMNLSHQYALSVPGSFASDYNSNCNESCYDQMCAVDANNFYEWALKDEQIIGINPWHWEYCKGCISFRDEIGTSQLNVTKATWRDIGQKIISTNN